jgi:predicted TIM-barrel fold metal-dependent hydrolase
VYLSFQEDDIGIRLRDVIGVDQLMWGSDYPHAESTFPKSREILDRILEGVPQDEKARIVGTTTARLYGFDMERIS